MKKSLLAACLLLTFAGGCTLPFMQDENRPDAGDIAAVPGEAARQKIAASLRAGHHAEALALIRAERGRSRASLTDEYVQAMQGVIATADGDLQKENFEAAGKGWRTALDHFSDDPSLTARIGRSRGELEAALNACADRLIERGLAAYRSNDLEGAIRIWKRILVFHPQHEGARKVIQTTELQLRKLRTLP